MKHWVSTETDLLPDFIIGGAMKSGTSTLRTILRKHPKIFIPDKEIHFFDMDNILQHSDFNFYHENEWTTQKMHNGPKQAWEWYRSHFEGHEGEVKGEDSTTYLASRIAAERIAVQKKKIKMLFLLRQPSLRAYSNYNHLLRTGRAIYSFEDTLRYSPFQVINRSLYKEQLEYFYKKMPRESIKVILFEKFVKDPENVVEEICTFIGVDPNELPPGSCQAYSNKGRFPKNSKLYTKKNFWMRSLGNTRYNEQLPFKGPVVKRSTPFLFRVIDKIHNRINPLIPIIPAINEETKLFLDDYFLEELKGIDELVDKDILSKWFPQARKMQ